MTNDDFRRFAKGKKTMADQLDESLARLLGRRSGPVDEDVVETHSEPAPDRKLQKEEQEAAVKVLVSPVMGLRLSEAKKLVSEAVKKLGEKYTAEDIIGLVLRTRR